MKKIMVTMFVLVVLLTACENYLYKPYNAYVFLGGSNVCDELADGFRDCITQYDETALVIQHGHEDADLADWVYMYYDSYKPQHNLTEDTGVVNAMLRDGYGVKLMFWFQGEADTLEDFGHTYYETRLGFVRDAMWDEFPGVKFCTVQTFIEDLDGHATNDQNKIRDAQRKLGFYDFDSQYYNREDDNIKLTESEAYRFGWWMANQYAKLRDWK